MFRFYKLYSLYLNNMASGLTGPREWCLCEKLPRAMLHIPVEPESMRCEVCGLARRPRDHSIGSSSDEEPPQAAVEENNTANPSKNVPNGLKVAVKAKKPQKSKTNCLANCVKCVGAGVGGEVTAAPEEQKDKVYSGRHGLYKKPKKKTGRHALPDRRQKNEPSAPPPSSPSPPPPPSQSESYEDMPPLVIMAHEVFNRPYHLRRRCSGGFRNILVSDFIPLNSPITDRSGGAISKRSKVSSGNLPSTHSSAPLPPLSKILANILAKHNPVTVREKGGGLVPPKPRDSLDADSELATQFSPFDSYEGPSEDALVVDSARQMLQRPMSLYAQPRTDLLNNDVEAADFDHRSGYGSTPISPPRKKSASDHVKPFSDTNGFSIFANGNNIQSSSSSKNSSVSSNSSNPSIRKSLNFCEVGDENDDNNNSEKLPTDSSNTFVSMDKIFWAPKSQNNSDEEEFLSMDQMDELNDWMRHLSHNDHGINSAGNVDSSNKTEKDEEYSKNIVKYKLLEPDNYEGLTPPKIKPSEKPAGQKKPKVESKIPPHPGQGKRHICKVQYNPSAAKKCQLHGNISNEVPRTKVSKHEMIQNTSNNEKKCTAKRVLPHAPRPEDKSNGNPPKTNDGKESQGKKNNAKICQIHKSPENTFDDKKNFKFQMQSTNPTKGDPKKKKINRIHLATCPYTKMIRQIKTNKGTQNKIQTNQNPEIEQSNNNRQQMTQGREKILFPRDKNTMDPVPIQTHLVKHIGTALHTCWELPPSQTVKHHVQEMGVIQISDIPPTIKAIQSSIFEFRLPDIDPSELDYPDYEDHNDLEWESDEDETPEANVRHTQEENKSKTTPLTYRRRQLQYDEVEVSFDVEQTSSRIELNPNLVQRQNVVHKEEMLSGVLEGYSQSYTIVNKKYKPIKLIKNVAYEKSEEDSQHENIIPNSPIEEKIQPRDNQENPNNQRHPSKYKYSDLSRDTRKRIDISLESKIKNVMNRPLGHGIFRNTSAITSFFTPVTNKFNKSEDSDEESSNSSSKQRSVGETEDEDSYHGYSCSQLNMDVKTTAYPDYPFSFPDSNSRFLSMASAVDINSDHPSEPTLSHKQTLYEGLPPLNWKLISLGTPRPMKSDDNEQSESAIGEKFACPIYECTENISLESLPTHIIENHRTRVDAASFWREDYHRLIEGLPKQFIFDSDKLTAGNSFVALLLYTSLTKSTNATIPLRDYPLVLVAALKKSGDLPAGYFFWFVGYPTTENLQLKLTVYDPAENVGRTRIITPRNIADHQDPLCFTLTTRDHLLLKIPPKHRKFQINLEANTEL
ncbi:hypothetical protein KR074_006032 [Drosophila pseudoananassae]|nr:hypothetical protein KR074_006032 [Drosophila pseudoananassae]